MKGNPFYLYHVFFSFFVRRIMVDLKCASGRRGRKRRKKEDKNVEFIFMFDLRERDFQLRVEKQYILATRISLSR